MPQQSSQGRLRPLTGFSFAAATATNRKQAPADAGQGGRTSLNETVEGRNGEVGVEEDRQARRGGAPSKQGAVPKPQLKPLSSLIPGPSRSTTPSKPPSAATKPLAKPLTSFAAPPPRPSPAPSTSASISKPPPLKRQKRVLATEEEVQSWKGEKEVEIKRADKGKGRAEETEKEVDRDMREDVETKKSRPSAKPPEPAATKPTFRPVATFGVFSPAPQPRTSTFTPKPRKETPARQVPLARPLHTLAALSPFSSSSTPAPKPRSESQATPVTRLFGQLPTPLKNEDGDEKKPFEGRSILTMAPPKPPVVAEDSDVEVAEAGVPGWSPGKKGKKGGYLLSGIAFRASSLLSSARTDQTLWLHDFSRTLNSLPLPAPVSSLLEALPPALRLTVLSIPSFQLDGGVTEDVTVRGGRRTLLAQCKLELDASAASPGDHDEASPPRDLLGLVLFSLHSYPTSSATLPPPSPVKSRKDASSASSSSDSPKTLYVPTNPHDLHRFLVREFEGAGQDGVAQRGVEVWVYPPFYPVELLPEPEVGDPSPFAPARTSETAERDAAGEGVEWDEDLERKREEERRRAKEAERQKKALVVGRFAVLV
ncbi:hypothetical protein JCM6882_000348 [Rhodosporidiobolus microsporus]